MTIEDLVKGELKQRCHSERSGRKRRYRAAFIAKLSDAESGACETQVWIEFAVRCSYLGALRAEKLTDKYEQIMGQVVKMIDESDKWLIRASKITKRGNGK